MTGYKWGLLEPHFELIPNLSHERGASNDGVAFSLCAST
jgi:hypothetical protein